MIDAHAHIWQIGRHGQVWPPPTLEPLRRDFVVDDWQKEVARTGIDKVVLVQSQPDAEDTDWLLRVARREASVAGVVGWVDLAAPDAPARIRTLATSSALRGLRVMLENMPADNWICQPSLEPAISMMTTHDLRLDVLVRPRHLPCVRQFSERHPRLRIVVDHAAKPDIARGEWGAWRDDIMAVAALPNVFCKLSGLITEAARGWAPRDLEPYVQWAIECFGSRRLMWGSDWPVLSLAGSYAGWLQAAETLVERLGGDREAIFAATARDFYRIE